VAFDYFRLGPPPDQVAPTVTTTVSQPDGANGWHRTPATVTATATDDREGTPGIEYRSGSGDWVPYQAPVVLDQDGTHELEFRAVDAAGNMSSVAEAMALVDRTAPTPTVSGVTAGGKYDVGTALKLAAAADDPVSGVASVRVLLDGAPVQTPLNVTPTAGAHSLRVVATDEAGNAAEVTVPFEVTVTYGTATDLLTKYRAEGRVTLGHYLQLYVYLAAAQVLDVAGFPQLAGASLDRFAAIAGKVKDVEVRTQLQAIATVLKTGLTA
jgi:hypothetical protein